MDWMTSSDLCATFSPSIFYGNPYKMNSCIKAYFIDKRY